MIGFSTVQNLKRGLRAKLASKKRVVYITMPGLQQRQTEKEFVDAYNNKYPSRTKQLLTSTRSNIVKNLGQDASTLKNRVNKGTATTVAKSALEKMVSGGDGSYSERMFAHTELFPQEERSKPEWGSRGRIVRIVGRQ